MIFPCHHCGCQISASPELVNRLVQCPACLSTMLAAPPLPVVAQRHAQHHLENVRLGNYWPDRTEPILFATLSAVIAPGVGQIALGQHIKGVCVLAIFLVSIVPSLGLSALLFYPASAVDAYLIARKIGAGKVVGQWEFFNA